jgi:hypothetical protein
MNLDFEIKFQNFITESATANVNDRPSQDPEYISTFYTQEDIQKSYQAGYAFGFCSAFGLIFVIVWHAPTRTSELPLKLPLLRILSYSALSRQ